MGAPWMQEFDRAGFAAHLLLRYTQVLLTQTAETAACNPPHPLDQRFCLWRLLSLDRLLSNGLVIAHELIAHMLGVRREGVTKSASKLKQAGMIDWPFTTCSL